MGKSFIVLTVTAAFLASSGAAIAAPDLRDAPAPEAMQASSPIETIAYTRRKTPTPTAGYMKSAGYSGGGLAGVLISLATTAAMDHLSGSRTMAEHQLRDPSPDISQALAETLAQHRGAIVATAPVFIKGGKPAAIAKAAPGARYVVDVQTLDWQVAGMSTRKSQYPSSYAAGLSVIDGLSGKVAVSSNCYWASPQIKVNAEGLTGDKTEILRHHFAAATEACLEQFKITIRSLHLLGVAPEPRVYAAPHQVAALPPLAAMPGPQPAPEVSQIEHGVARPGAVAMVALPPAPAAPQVVVQARTAPPPALAGMGQPPPSLPSRARPRPAPTVHAQAARWEPQSVAPSLPPYVEYPYARPYEAPPSRTPPPPEARYANGYLTGPGKRP